MFSLEDESIMSRTRFALTEKLKGQLGVISFVATWLGLVVCSTIAIHVQPNVNTSLPS